MSFFRRVSLSAGGTVKAPTSRPAINLAQNIIDRSSPPPSPALSTRSLSPTQSASASSSVDLKRTDNNLRRLSHVLSKLTAKRSSRPSSLVETEPPKIVPIVAKFEHIDETPTPSYVEVEEVSASLGNKSALRFSRVEQVDFSIFDNEQPEQHATDKMVKVQELLLSAEDPSYFGTADSDEPPPPLSRADRSWLKSALSL